MESGIFHEHKTVIVFGGNIGLVSGANVENTNAILIGELNHKYQPGEEISKEDSEQLVKNAEVCILFPELKDAVTFRDFVCDMVDRIAREKERNEESRQRSVQQRHGRDDV